MTANFFSNQKLRFLIILLGIIVLIFLNLVLIFLYVDGKNSKKYKGFETSTSLETLNPIREKGYNFCKPLLMVDIPAQSKKLEPLKKKIENFIQTQKSKGLISTASVYFKAFNNGNWLQVNESEKYYPASMFKLPILISFLKLAEEEPGLFDQKTTIKNEQPDERDPRNAGDYLHKGQAYSYREILKYMIVNSDNEAADILAMKVGIDNLEKLCIVLGINGDMSNKDFQISVADMSKFMRVLFNASYLSPENSDYALQLLTESKYGEGIRKFIDPSIVIAHKFGERNIASDPQLHETAIIYLNNNPVVLTIMTKGNNYNNLSDVIAQMSKMILIDVIENSAGVSEY